MPTEDQDKGQSRAEDDFRFHGIAMLPYINAHELASCNSDSCSLCGNLGLARRLCVRRIDRRSTTNRSANFPAKRQTPKSRFSPTVRSDHSRLSADLAFESDRGWNFLAQEHDLQCSNSWSRRRLAEELEHSS